MCRQDVILCSAQIYNNVLYELCCIFHIVQCTTLFCIVLYFTVLYRTVQHCTVQYCTALYFSLLFLYFICFQTQHLTIVLIFQYFLRFHFFCKFILAKIKLQSIFWEKVKIFKCIFSKNQENFSPNHDGEHFSWFL